MILAALLLALLHQKPDVVVIVADDLGWSEIPLMPNVQGLAAQGMTFDRFYTLPTCSPTRYALECGRFPRRQETVALVSGALAHQPGGIGDLSFNAHSATQERIPLGTTFLPEAFQEDYSTHLIGKWHLGRPPLLGEMDQVPGGPYAQGFDDWRAGSPTITSAGPGASGYYDWNRVELGDMFMSTEYATDAQRNAFVALWGEAHDRPRFTVLSWNAPHDPFDTPPGMTPAGTTRGAYELAVSYLDTALGVVLGAIDLQTTYVVFLADNGTPDNAAPVSGFTGFWKGSTFEGGVRVPMIVAGPGISAGLTSHRLVQVEDIAATLAELTCTPLGAGFEDSVSFADTLGLGTGEPAREFVFTERYEVLGAASYPQPAGYDSVALIEDEWKLITSTGDPGSPGDPWTRLYFLPGDPYEQLPLDPTASYPMGVQKLINNAMTRMAAHLASLPPRAP